MKSYLSQPCPHFYACLLIFLISNQLTFSQKKPNPEQKDSIPFVRFGDISTKFTKSSFKLEESSIISNVLKVVNHGELAIDFVVDLTFPNKWTRIDDIDKVYRVQPKDTMIVPIIISPSKKISGNTEIVINAFVINKDGQQIGNNFFTLNTVKKVAWGIGLENNTTFYFKNDENERQFHFSIENNGNYNQDIFFNFTIPRKDLIIADSLSQPIKDLSQTFTLKANEQKEFSYRAIATVFNERNKKRISINNFSPVNNRQRITRVLFINSSEPTKVQNNSSKRRTKVNFVKLPNEVEVNRFGYDHLPMIVDLNAQNILDNRTFLSLNLQGFKQLDENSNLVYFTQLNYSNSFFTNNVFKNAPWYVGYFDQKKTIEIGQVNGEMIGASSIGKGFKTTYRFNEKHLVGAFYTSSNGLFNDNNSIISYGSWYRMKYDENIRLNAAIGRNSNNFVNRKSTIISVQPSVRFLDIHNLSLLGGYNRSKFENNGNEISNNGFLVGANYGTSLLKKKLISYFSFRFNDRNFSNGTNERMFFNQRLSYDISKDWESIFLGNYQKISVYSNSTNLFQYSQENFFTNVTFSKKTQSGSYQPGIFYEYRDFPNNSFVIRGLSFRYALFNMDENLLSSVFLRAGYAKPKNQIDPKEYFSFEANSLLRYRTWNLTARYNLGTFSSISSQQNQSAYTTPQSIRLSLQNQYLFKDRHFTLESNLIYSFNNIFKNHTFSLFPQLFYFTDSGWRFGISTNYIYTTSDFSSIFDINNPNNPNQISSGPSVNSNFNLNFNLRKEFGIPLPFTEKIAASTKLISFLDVNGNGIKEKDETSLQNIVIKLNKNEVITNFDGEASMKNLKFDTYRLEVLSLEELNGWFPNVKDSIPINTDGITYIPFVRGIKVYGDVIIDRQKIAVSDEKPLDLSRIKISATNDGKVYNALTNSKGQFEFYLPFGQYTITMDEGILGDRFMITRNNLSVKLRNNQDAAYLSFYIVEKRRKVIFKDFTKQKN